jgi:hypothetical protein
MNTWIVTLIDDSRVEVLATTVAPNNGGVGFYSREGQSDPPMTLVAWFPTTQIKTIIFAE